MGVDEDADKVLELLNPELDEGLVAGMSFDVGVLSGDTFTRI